MALNIKNARTEALAHELAARTGETLTTAVTRALEARLSQLTPPPDPTLLAEIADLQALVAGLPTRHGGPDDAILGYDAQGLPA